MARALQTALQQDHGQAVWVPEILRDWCVRRGRTPRPQEQQEIALAQAQAIDSAGPGYLLADTTPLMTAVYSDVIFGDQSLYRFALEHHTCFELTLLTDTDLPWVADGLQRDGPQVREPVDALLRAALHSAGVAYKVVYGQGPERLNNALLALGWEAPCARVEAQYALNRGRTAWNCDKCSDAACEHRLFTDLIQRAD